MPTAPTRLTGSSASAGSAPTRKAASSASAGSAPTRLAATSATAGDAPDRLTGVAVATVAEADASYNDDYAEILLTNGPYVYGITVGMFVSATNIPAGTSVLTLEETKVTLSALPTGNGPTGNITFSRVPPAPTRKSS